MFSRLLLVFFKMNADFFYGSIYVFIFICLNFLYKINIISVTL